MTDTAAYRYLTDVLLAHMDDERTADAMNHLRHRDRSDTARQAAELLQEHLWYGTHPGSAA